MGDSNSAECGMNGKNNKNGHEERQRGGGENGLDAGKGL
jgi:hypothetical protein